MLIETDSNSDSTVNMTPECKVSRPLQFKRVGSIRW